MIDLTIPYKLWTLFSTEQRRVIIVLFCLMMIGMIMETMGIGLVIPALALITQDDLADKYPVLIPWLNIIGNPGREKLIISGMLVLVIVYTIKVLFLGFLVWRQSAFVLDFQANLSQRLCTIYLQQPYTFHLQRNSSELIRNTIGQVNDIKGVVNQGLIFLTELLVLIGISAILLIVEPA